MVNTSLFTGLSGLRSHQRWMDVIGNNLANVSTPGFWGSRATFGDLLSFTVRSGSGPVGNFGGSNPMQLGLGTTIASIDLNTNQGTFTDTGRSFDVAIQGDGFFTLSDGAQSYFTRVGSFGIDATRNLVDMRTGHRVVSASGANITVPVTDTLPPTATSRVAFQGNLPATVKGPLEEILESASALQAGTAATRTGTPATGTTYDISAFTGRTILVSVDGGAKQTVTFPASAFGNPAAATASEIAARFTAAGIPGLTVTPNNGTGAITYDTVKLGTAASLKFDDGAGAAGFLNVLGLNASLVTGTQSAATAATDLADLTGRITPYISGDQIAISGTNPDGSAVSNTFVYGTSGTTLGDLITFLNSTYDATQVTASLQPNGTIRLTATDKEPATLSLFIGDASGNTGTSTWPNFKVTQDGTGPDSATTSIDVFDSLGRSHSVTMKFTRTVADPAVWDLTASMPAADGTAVVDTISSIRFNPDGSFNVVGGGNNAFTFSFNGIPGTQNVTVDLGSSGGYEGVVMLGDKTTVAATDQDGRTTGTLLNVGFDQVGQLTGFYSNGESRVLDTLRITTFPNEGGLMRVGDTMFIQSPNSDDPIATTAGSAGAGIVRAGSLENSNVDIAEEFVRLIEAQRGFQANARVITTTDEILAELVNIVN